MRATTHLEGLALAGEGTAGPVRLDLPALLEPAGEAVDEARPTVAWEPAAAGLRRLVVGAGSDRLRLELPVLAPEIGAGGSGVHPVGPGAYLLRAPIPGEALRELRHARPDLLILGNARALFRDGEPFVRAVGQLRTEVGAEPLLWAPRVGLPHRLPLLAYLGIDLVDTTEAELRAAGGEFLDASLGPRPDPGPGPARGCDCPACRPNGSGDLVEHARATGRRALLELRAALRRHALRELVEARLGAEPALAEMLRYADRDLAGLLEGRAPVVGEGVRSYVFAESLRRPEMRRFRDRLIERYRPPPSKSVLLLVPCSRTKPYRRSPSHRRLAQAWDGVPGSTAVHVVSVSSPIGVVPRELEDVPPARHYDVPVTGDWSEEERGPVVRGVRHLLESGTYRRVLVHLDPAEYRFLLDALPPGVDVRQTCPDGRTTSPAAIAELRVGLEEALAEGPAERSGPLAVVAEELRELASVQFGRAAAGRLFAPPLRLAGRPWFQRLTDGHRDLASVREERGLFHLTVAGAERLGPTVPRVDADPALSLEGDLFAPGVRGADPSVRIGDSVGIFQDGRLAAVGEAALPGPLLGDVRRGLAVRVRHRRHAPADTAKTGGP